MQIVRAIVRDWRTAPIPEKEKELLAYAEKITRAPHSMTKGDIESLTAWGWRDEEIHDAIQVIAYFNYINRLADGLGVQADAWLVEFEQVLQV